jgi:ubiquinone/menaquinone biosynthesis C-methylase UbiE
MASVDVYRVTDQLDDVTLAALVTRLEARGKHPRFAAMMEAYFAAMRVHSANRVLDLGCGTGVAARAVASRAGFSGHVTGVDVSPYLAAEARRLAASEGLAETIEFCVGDSQRLDFPDNAFDAAVAHTLLSHVRDPLSVLKELRRVVRPGGMVGVFDGDYASLTFGSTDPEQGEADDDTIINAIVTHPRVMRQMPQLLRDAGLDLTASFAYVVADVGKADFWISAIQSFVRLLPRAGAMTEVAARSWADEMTRRSEEGIFFGASNYYSFVATRLTAQLSVWSGGVDRFGG